MEVNVKSKSPLTIEIVGRLDTVTADEFHEKVEQITSDNTGNIVLECKNMTYVSSSGLRVLLMMARKAKAANNTIFMRGLNSSVREVMEISGFDSFFDIED